MVWALSMVCAALGAKARLADLEGEPYYSAIFATKKGETLDVYAAVGRAQVFAHDEVNFRAVSVQFKGPAGLAISATESHVGAAGELSQAGPSQILIKSTTPDRLTPGLLATVTFAKGTDMSHVEVDYTDAEHTFIDVLPGVPPLTHAHGRGHGPAIVVLAGTSETEKAMLVFAPGDAVRAIGLGFSKPVQGLLSTPSSYTTHGPQVVSVSAFVGRQKIGWGVFGHPFSMPTGTILSKLTFSQPMRLSDIDGASKDTIIESKNFKVLDEVIVVFKGELRHAPTGHGSGGKAGEWKVGL